ncbi:MAG TPA: hypothetical protein VFO89_09830 [Thermoanaerobaculia bacterium]|nr:hypothetical protein [Thermoanaerobaculia bacterium]
MIEKRGATVYVSPETPDALAEHFLREVLACPHCIAEARRNGTLEELPDRPVGH